MTAAFGTKKSIYLFLPLVAYLCEQYSEQLPVLNGPGRIVLHNLFVQASLDCQNQHHKALKTRITTWLTREKHFLRNPHSRLTTCFWEVTLPKSNSKHFQNSHRSTCYLEDSDTSDDALDPSRGDVHLYLLPLRPLSWSTKYKQKMVESCKFSKRVILLLFILISSSYTSVVFFLIVNVPWRQNWNISFYLFDYLPPSLPIKSLPEAFPFNIFDSCISSNKYNYSICLKSTTFIWQHNHINLCIITCSRLTSMLTSCTVWYQPPHSVVQYTTPLLDN